MSNLILIGLGIIVAPYLIYKLGVCSVKYQLKKNIIDLENKRIFTFEPIDILLQEHVAALNKIQEWEKGDKIK